ncbi:helix-turn-helix domain-containing protein [Nocardioides sp. NPDC006273]|uniref:helix-turn-helix domain-containing protein n=1 Tax=Nocardioides sp. NPDC006273 TaxID=3155598 RepID=UPI0033A7F0D8
MYAAPIRAEALALLEQGESLSAVARATGVARSTVREWRDREPSSGPGACPRCDDLQIDEEAYAALLGFYLGDGYIARAARYYFLRISCDLVYPQIIEDVIGLLDRIRPGGRVFRVPRTGCLDVHSNWMHWPCLFPQHGAGRKHTRPIVLKPWQLKIVESCPADFLRGLFHSDGSRSINTVTRRFPSGPRTYVYPRWQFVNVSDDIRGLCAWALDLVEIPWRQSNWRTISVSRRDAVAALDALIGPKS